MAEIDMSAGECDQMVTGAHRRIWGLVARFESVAELVGDRSVVERARQVLGDEIVVQNVCAHVVDTGAPRQFLHADQQSAPVPWDHPSVVTAVWMLDEFTSANGATRVVSGSHLNDRPPAYGSPLPSSVPVGGDAGRVLVLDGRLWHQAGENLSAFSRTAVLVTYARPEVSRHPRFVEGGSSVVRRRLHPLEVAAPPAVGSR